jgi:hypothetical protein
MNIVIEKKLKKIRINFQNTLKFLFKAKEHFLGDLINNIYVLIFLYIKNMPQILYKIKNCAHKDICEMLFLYTVNYLKSFDRNS